MSVSLSPPFVSAEDPDPGKADTSGGANMAFILVPVFFLLGLLGVVICHVLKRKGYRCTTEAQEDGEEGCGEEAKDLEMGGGRKNSRVDFKH